MQFKTFLVEFLSPHCPKSEIGAQLLSILYSLVFFFSLFFNILKKNKKMTPFSPVFFFLSVMSSVNCQLLFSAAKKWFKSEMYVQNIGLEIFRSLVWSKVLSHLHYYRSILICADSFKFFSFKKKKWHFCTYIVQDDIKIITYTVILQAALRPNIPWQSPALQITFQCFVICVYVQSLWGW